MLSLNNAAIALGQQVVLKKWSAQQVLSYIEESGDPVLIDDEKQGVGGHFSVIRSYTPAITSDNPEEALTVYPTFKHGLSSRRFARHVPFPGYWRRV
jgi:hypothetical protein